MADPKSYPPTPYERHVFVCTAGKECPGRGGEEICDRLRRLAKDAGVADRIRVNRSGCLNQCDAGPMLVVYPEAIWLAGVAAEDVAEIFEKTVLRGESIPRLAHPRSREAR